LHWWTQSFFYQWMTLSNIFYQWTHTARQEKRTQHVSHYYDKSDVHWPMVFTFLFLFVLLFFSLWVSDKEKSTSVTFSAYIYEVITLNEQILSLSLSLSLCLSFLLVSIQTHVKTTRRYVCVTYRWTNDEKQEKRIRELTGNWTHTYKTGAFAWINRFVLHKFLFLLSYRHYWQVSFPSALWPIWQILFIIGKL
jgi:hypothetical protein